MNEALAYIDKSLDNVADLDPDTAWTNVEVVEVLEDIRSLLVAGELTPERFEQAHTVQDAEEPEWEYGNEQLMHSHVEVLPASSEAVAKAQAWLYPVRRRRKAGPWEVVEQGDAS